MAALAIHPLEDTPQVRTALTEILIEVVAAGASVHFMHPLKREDANAFWDGALAAAARGERVILGAWDGNVLAGTVTLQLHCPPNQPHRAEIAKMMTRFSHRGRGIGTALLQAAEEVAVQHRRSLLVLDTARDEGASAFYERQGYRLAGEIPDYAFRPHGALTATMIYWKRVMEELPQMATP
ncbi:MAG TPA: GNAT family N-acetyltransferase [Rhizomicrobium sp.]|nr:GNAT family N-acetyltransferase [Rhizomicrobium sp.]